MEIGDADLCDDGSDRGHPMKVREWRTSYIAGAPDGIHSMRGKLPKRTLLEKAKFLLLE